MTESFGSRSARVNRRPWKPLLEGIDAALARDTALQIASAVEELSPSPLPGLRGDASIALLLAHCGRPTSSPRLEMALAATVARSRTISLSSGISGMSWVLDHLVARDEAEELIARFDVAIERHLRVRQWQERLDLVTGLVGVGVSVADRRDRRALEIADLVLSHLESAAVTTAQGTTWYTPPAFVPETRRGSAMGGLVDLGVAHGVPGVIGMLARFVDNDVEGSRSRRLLESTVAWLLESVPRDRPRFGTSWPVLQPELRRIGWCYGDAGVAGVLLRAGRALGAPDVENEALGLLRQLATPPVGPAVADASFCHGAAGLAHIYNVAFQYTRSEQMCIEARRWLAEVLRLRNPRGGIGGYESLKLGDGGPRWEADTTLISGATGIALVLLAAVEDREPVWQRLFLL